MRRILVVASMCVAVPAWAQDADQPAPPPTAPPSAPPRRDTVTIAVGGGVYPRFQGAKSSGISPVGALRGTVRGIDFSTSGTALVLNVAQTGGRTDVAVGPVIQGEFNRSGVRDLHDPQVSALGKIKTAVELGGHLNVSRTGIVTSAYDSLTFDLQAVADVTGVNNSFVVTPSVSYGTPFSRHAYVGLSVSADYVGSGYARTYFGVTPMQQLASGLTAFSPGAGIKDVGVGAVVNRSITGDLRHGLSAYAVANYSRLLGDIRRSPIVRDANQVFGSLGLAYTF